MNWECTYLILDTCPLKQNNNEFGIAYFLFFKYISVVEIERVVCCLSCLIVILYCMSRNAALYSRSRVLTLQSFVAEHK